MKTMSLVSAIFVSLSSLLAGCAGDAQDAVDAQDGPTDADDDALRNAPAWPGPSASGQKAVSATLRVTGTFDGRNVKYYGAPGTPFGQDPDNDKINEKLPPIFLLADGATLKNVILGAPGAKGVICEGSCTLDHVWWEDVGEDAASFLGSSGSPQMKIIGGGAKLAKDKVFQHDGTGTVTISDFYVASFGKLYRSCGDCSRQFHDRRVVVRGVTAIVDKSSDLVGINKNYGDSAELSGLTIYSAKKHFPVCELFNGSTKHNGSSKIGASTDPKYCNYDPSKIIYH